MTPAYRATRRLTGLSNPILIVSGVIGLRRLVSASKRALRAQPRHRRAAGHDDIPPRGGAGDGGPEPTLAADRYRTIVDVYVLLRRPAGTILLLERSGTGYADGQLCPAGTWRPVNLWSRERSAKRARKQAS